MLGILIVQSAARLKKIGLSKINCLIAGDAMAQAMKRVRISWGWAAIVVLLSFFVGVPYILIRHAMPRSELARLSIGMTKDEVRSVLGAPNQGREGGSQWVFFRWGNAGWVEVHFDDADLLWEINDESVFP